MSCFAAERMSTQGSAVHDSDLHNQENMLSRLRGAAAKNRVENRENVNPNPKAGNRTVLGELENNQRRQLGLRGAKQVCTHTVLKCAFYVVRFRLYECSMHGDAV